MAQTATQERTNVAEFAHLAQLPARAAGNTVHVPEPQAQKTYPPKLAKAIMAITREFGAIKKDGWNDFHKYHYQKWEDVLERESVLLPQHGTILQQSEVARSILDKLISITYEFTIINEDGDVWPDRISLTAIARLSDNKGIFDDKAANKCHTQAHKYFLLHFFKIRTKESVAEDADGDGDEVPPKQIVAPKPPKPGSAEAKALEGPRVITGTGPKPEDWVDAFIASVERAESTDEIDQWLEANKGPLDKLREHYPDEFDRVTKAINNRRDALNAAKPKPPRPGAATKPPSPKPNPMPDAAEKPAEFIEWLKVKFEGFQSYEAGERYWNETVEAMDLSREVQEDAMAVWSKFESIWAP